MFETFAIVHDLVRCDLGVEEATEIIRCRHHGVCRALLTPAAAKWILENHNAKNRGVKRHQVKFLRRQIESGKFVFNGETIIVGDNGNILNGQHRLIACCETGEPIDVLMVFGIPEGAFATLDQGARRKGADVLQIEGHKNCNLLAATLRQIDYYFLDALGRPHANGPDGDRGRGDNSHTLVLLEKYPMAEESVSAMKKGAIATPGSVAAALHYLFSQKSPEQAAEFFDVVLNGFQLGRVYTDIGESAGMLREWLMRAAIGNKKTATATVANVWIKAWNAGRTGVLPKLFKWSESEGQIEIR